MRFTIGFEKEHQAIARQTGAAVTRGAVHCRPEIHRIRPGIICRVPAGRKDQPLGVPQGQGRDVVAGYEAAALGELVERLPSGMQGIEMGIGRVEGQASETCQVDVDQMVADQLAAGRGVALVGRF